MEALGHPDHRRPTRLVSQKQKPQSAGALGKWSASGVGAIDHDEYPIPLTQSISSDNNTSPDTLVLNLQDPAEPPRRVREHLMRITCRKSAAGGHTVNCVTRLMQGATTIATVTHTDVPEEWTTNVYQLTQAEVDSITDYAALTLEVDRQGDTGGNPSTRRSLELAYLQFEVPSEKAGL